MEEDDRRRPRAQPQTDRDLESERTRRERRAFPLGVPIRDPIRDQVDELADALNDGAVGPGDPIDDDNTQPLDMRELGPLTPRERELWDRMNRIKAEMRRSKRGTDDKILDAMGRRPPNDRFAALETRVKIIWAILAAVGSVAIGAAVTVAKGLYERGETDGQHEIRLQQVERAVQRLESHDLFGRRRSDQPDQPPFYPSAKASP